MTDFVYPGNYQLRVIEREKIVRLTQDRPVFDILPLLNVDAAELIYEQPDNVLGLQQSRGINGSPMSVKRLGISTKVAQPGYYGEFVLIDEYELTKRRMIGTANQPIDITDLVTSAQEQLLSRRIDRQEVEMWNMLLNGTFSALGNVGQVLHTDTYAIQTFTASVTWATFATSTPLANLRALKLKARGHSVSFGRSSTLWLNQGTANNLFSNTNQQDLGSKRAAGLSSVTGLDEVNRILMMEDLPNVAIYDETYFDDAGNYQLFIPDNKGVLVGRRTTGVPVGNFQLTRNANNPDMAPGAYTRVIDNVDRSIPREIQVHDGMNGGAVMYYPASIVSCTL